MPPPWKTGESTTSFLCTGLGSFYSIGLGFFCSLSFDFPRDCCDGESMTSFLRIGLGSFCSIGLGFFCSSNFDLLLPFLLSLISYPLLYSLQARECSELLSG
jgi:hypothetical protein